MPDFPNLLAASHPKDPEEGVKVDQQSEFEKQLRLQKFFQQPCPTIMTFADVANATLGNVHPSSDLHAIARDLHQSLPESRRGETTEDSLEPLLMQNARAGAGAAIGYQTDEGDAFLRAQSSRPTRNFVMIHGGAREDIESLQETARREATEELGYPPEHGLILAPIRDGGLPKAIVASVEFTPKGVATYLLEQNSAGRKPFFYASALYKNDHPIHKQRLFEEINQKNSALLDHNKIGSYKRASDMLFGDSAASFGEATTLKEGQKEIQTLLEKHSSLIPPSLASTMKSALSDDADVESVRNGLEAHVAVSENQKLDLINRDEVFGADEKKTGLYFKPVLEQFLALTRKQGDA